MDDFVSKSPENQKIIVSSIMNKPKKRHTSIWNATTRSCINTTTSSKKYNNHTSTPSITIRENKGILYYCRRFQDLSINGTNNILYYIHKTLSPKIGVPLTLLLTVFRITHSHDLSGHPSRVKTYAKITENHYFPNFKTWIAILTQGCLNC